MKEYRCQETKSRNPDNVFSKQPCLLPHPKLAIHRNTAFTSFLCPLQNTDSCDFLASLLMTLLHELIDSRKKKTVEKINIRELTILFILGSTLAQPMNNR